MVRQALERGGWAMGNVHGAEAQLGKTAGSGEGWWWRSHTMGHTRRHRTTLKVVNTVNLCYVYLTTFFNERKSVIKAYKVVN